MWNGPYRTVNYLKSTLWTIPFLAIVLVLAIAPAVRMLDAQLGWNSGLGVAGAQALYQTVITLALSFLVFTFGSLLVALQVASVQLTPRIIATTLLRDNVLRYTVGLFVFSLIFAVIALDRLNATVHEIVTLLTAALGISCIAAFLFLIDHAARLLRPVSMLACVGDAGMAVIESVYPQQVRDRGRVTDTDTTAGGPRRIVRHTGPPYILLEVDCASLVDEARESGGIIEVVPQIGDFVADGEPLFVLYGRTAALDDRVVRRRGRVRSRADDGRGPAVFLPHHRGHRAQSALSGDQRSDDGRTRPRPDSSPAEGCRQAAVARRDDGG